jgi:4'-phosphopantetheinyl transferase
VSRRPFVLSKRAVAPGADPGVLAPAERAAAARFDGRRLDEFVAGRLAAHAALQQLLGDRAAAIEIGRDAEGAPRIAGITGDVPKLSISHGKSEAVAVAGLVARLGVDLCEFADSPRVERVSGRFIHASERDLARGIGHPIGWATLWALKEAGAKALGVGLFDNGLKATRLASLDPPRFERPALEALVERDRDHVLAVVWSG